MRDYDLVSLFSIGVVSRQLKSRGRQLKSSRAGQQHYIFYFFFNKKYHPKVIARQICFYLDFQLPQNETVSNICEDNF